MPSNRPKQRQKPDRNQVENRVRGTAKRMRGFDELDKAFKKDSKSLTLDEERLLDLLTFQKTGKHIGRFKDKKTPTPKQKVMGHKLKLLEKDPLDPNITPSKQQQEIVEKRIALRASESVS